MPGIETPDRVLMIRPSALGDVCRTVPVLASLRAAWPDATIDWVVQSEFVPAVEAHPALSSVIEFPRQQLRGWMRSPSRAKLLWTWVRALRRPRYDVAIDCQGLARSAGIAIATHARVRVGERRAREGAWLGYNHRVPISEPRHAVDRMLDLVAYLDVPVVHDMRLTARPDDLLRWARRAEELGLVGRRWAVLAPSSRWVSKRWPPERWAELVPALRDRGYERIVLVGSPSEREETAAVRAAAGGPSDVIDLAGQIDIGELMSVIAGTDLVVANDSAPLHMAVGFDRPCVGIFGPTDPALVGPYGRLDTVVRAADADEGTHYRDRGLGDRVMRAIPVASVIERIDEVCTDAIATSPTSMEPAS
jgi:lipopolysaccharide heptosyltransferase I